jgi:hypothetical protein
MPENRHIDGFVDNAENIEPQGFFEQRFSGRVCQQDAWQQGIIHSNNFYYNQTVGAFRIHIDNCGMDAFVPDYINEISGIFSYEQINTPWSEYLT